MGTNTLSTVSAGTIAASHFNQFVTALLGDIVPRNSSGVATDLAGDFGTATYPWKTIYGDAITISDISSDSDPFERTGNDVISGAVRAGSNQPAFLDPAGSGGGRSVTVLATATDLIISIDSVDVIVTADISVTSLTAAPGSNNTCLVNDAQAAGAFQERTWGEVGGEKESITVDAMGSEITALVDTFQAFKTGTECFFAYVESSTKLSKIYRGWFTDSTLAPVNRVALTDNDTITLLKTAWLFLRSDGTTVDKCYTNPKWQFDEPGSPASGDHWFSMSEGIWKRHNGSAFVDAGSTLIGLAVCDTSDCLYVRCEPFAANHRPDNSIELNRDSATVVSTANMDNEVVVAGAKLNFGPTVLTWDMAADLASTPDIYNGTEQASTFYFFYLNEFGERIISDIEPQYRRDMFGWYHPHNPWRAVGKGYNDGSSNLDYCGDFVDQYHEARNEIRDTEDYGQTIAASPTYTTMPHTSVAAFGEAIRLASDQFTFRERGYYFFHHLFSAHSGDCSAETRLRDVSDSVTMETFGIMATDYAVDAFYQEDCTTEALVKITNLAGAHEIQNRSYSNSATGQYSQTSIRKMKDLDV